MKVWSDAAERQEPQSLDGAWWKGLYSFRPFEVLEVFACARLSLSSSSLR